MTQSDKLKEYLRNELFLFGNIYQISDKHLTSDEVKTLKELDTYLRSIAQRLLKGVHLGQGVFVNDFLDEIQFSLCDDEDFNGCYLQPQVNFSQLKIIAVTRKALERSQNNEALLAGVLAHELGHALQSYLHKKKVANTKGEEGLSDLSAEVMLQTAGYNPKVFLSVLNEISSDMIDELVQVFSAHPTTQTRQIEAKKYLDVHSSEIAQIEKNNGYIDKKINPKLIEDVNKISPLIDRFERMWRATGKTSLEDFIAFIPSLTTSLYKTKYFYDDFVLSDLGKDPEHLELSFEPQQGMENQKVVYLNPVCREWIRAKIKKFISKKYDFNKVYETMTFNVLPAIEPYFPKGHSNPWSPKDVLESLVSDVFHLSAYRSFDKPGESLSELRTLFQKALEDSDHFEDYFKQIKAHPLLSDFYYNVFKERTNEFGLFQRGMAFVLSPYRKAFKIGDKVPFVSILEKLKTTSDPQLYNEYLQVLCTIGLYPFSFPMKETAQGNDEKTALFCVDNQFLPDICFDFFSWRKYVNDFDVLDSQLLFGQVNGKIYAYRYNQQNEIVYVNSVDVIPKFCADERTDAQRFFHGNEVCSYEKNVYKKWVEDTYYPVFAQLNDKVKKIDQYPISLDLLDDLSAMVNFSILTRLVDPKGLDSAFYDMKKLMPQFVSKGKGELSGYRITADMLKQYAIDDRSTRKVLAKYLEIAHFIVENYQSSDTQTKALALNLLKKISQDQGFWRSYIFDKNVKSHIAFFELISKPPFDQCLKNKKVQKALRSPYTVEGIYHWDKPINVVPYESDLVKDVFLISKTSEKLKHLIYDVNKAKQRTLKMSRKQITKSGGSVIDYALYFTEMIDELLNEKSVISIKELTHFHKLFFQELDAFESFYKDDTSKIDKEIDQYIHFIGRKKIAQAIRYHIKKASTFSQYPDITQEPQLFDPFLKLQCAVIRESDERGFEKDIVNATNDVLLENVKKLSQFNSVEELKQSGLLFDLLGEFGDLKVEKVNSDKGLLRRQKSSIVFTPQVLKGIFDKNSDTSVFNCAPEYYVGLYCLLAKKEVFPHSSSIQSDIGFEIASLIEKLPKEKQEALCFEMLRQSVKIENYELIQKLTALWSQSILYQVGKTDDMSESYRQKVLPFVEKMNPATTKDEDNDEPFLPVRVVMGKQLQDDLVSQYELSMDIDKASGNITSFLSDAYRTQKCGVLFDAVVFGSKYTGFGHGLTQFLLEPYSKYGAQNLSLWLNRYTEGETNYVPETFEIVHQSFWQLPFELRSIVFYTLYAQRENMQKDLQYDIERYLFDDDTPQIMIDALYNYASAVPEDEMYRAEFLLCDCLAVSKPTGEKSSPAKVLKLFLEAQGAAGIKIGQFLSARRELPEDVRQELLTLTNRASTPSRADIFKLLENYHPEILKEVKQNGVGRILGAASHYITLDLNDKEVLSISREKSGLRADSIFKRILKAIDLTMQEDREYRELLSLFRDAVEQAYSMNDIELDGNITIQQNLKAIDVFDGIQVKSGPWAVDFNVMKPSVDQRESNLTRVEISHDTGVYYSQSQKIIQKSNGYSWFDLEAMIQDPALAQTKYPAFKDFSHQELEQMRQSLAEANFMVNLRMLLKGDVFDDDRHSGQFNFNLKDDKTLQVDLYDFGALSLTPPSKKELNSLGRLIMKTYLDYQKMIQEGKQDVSLISLFTQAVSHEKQTLKDEKIYLSKVIRALGQLEHFGVAPKQMPALLKGVIQDIHPEILVGMAETYMPTRTAKENMAFNFAKKFGAINQIAEMVKYALNQNLADVIPLSLTQKAQDKPVIHTYPTRMRGPIVVLNNLLEKGKEAYTLKENESSVDTYSESLSVGSLGETDMFRIDAVKEDKKKKIIQNIESYRASQKKNEAQIILPNKSYMALCQILPQEMKSCEKEVLENQELKLYVSEKHYQKVLKALKEKQLVFKVVKPLNKVSLSTIQR